MKIEPIEEIIPLTIGNIHIENNLNQFSLLIEEVRNFGSTIIAEIFKDEKGINEYVRSVVSCFLRQLIEYMDAIAILIKKSSSDPCFLIVRGLFENHIYLKFVLQEKSEERAKAYYVSHLLTKKRKAEKQDFSTNLGKELKNKIEKDEISKYLTLTTQNCQSEIDKIDKILQKPQYQYLKNKENIKHLSSEMRNKNLIQVNR